MDYKEQCLCGGTEFFTQRFKVYFEYETQKFRICAKCGTIKMLSAYYNDEENKYKDKVQHKKEGK